MYARLEHRLVGCNLKSSTIGPDLWQKNNNDVLIGRYVYDLQVPSGTANPAAFEPKPSDGEVECFEVIPGSLVLSLLGFLLTSIFASGIQLLPQDEVLDRMRRALFKPNCALGRCPYSTSFLAPLLNLATPLSTSHHRFDHDNRSHQCSLTSSFDEESSHQRMNLITWKL